MPETLVTLLAWLAVAAIAVSAVMLGQQGRVPVRRSIDESTMRRRRLGLAVSISGPIAVVGLSMTIAVLTAAWLTLAVVAFAGVAVVAVVGLVLAPN